MKVTVKLLLQVPVILFIVSDFVILSMGCEGWLAGLSLYTCQILVPIIYVTNLAVILFIIPYIIVSVKGSSNAQDLFVKKMYTYSLTATLVLNLSIFIFEFLNSKV
jgi:hypothetical protein